MNIIKLTKKSNALFFAALLLVGTITASSPLFMLDAQAEPYYGMDKDRKQVAISSLKCNNINVNVNGLELDVLPPALSTLLTGGEADASTYSYGSGTGNYGSESSGSETDFRFICLNNNNNAVVVEQPISPGPQPTTGTLRVIKQVTCIELFSNSISIQQAVTPCQAVDELINEDDYNIRVEGNNPVPSQFQGSPTGTDVTLGPGDYIVVEEIDSDAIFGILSPIFSQFPDIASIGLLPPIFTGDCTEDSEFSERALGTIEAGELQTCNIENVITLGLLSPPQP